MTYEHSPDAVKELKTKHVARLVRRMLFLEGLDAVGETNQWDKSEIAALRAAVAELNELLNARGKQMVNIPPP